ncbi:hypothetical protein LOC67_20580 [Stieleria sp. JC731]|uniref:hypothetical protein n=1 Tax=Pirellulaceae TaxID=2691357 RepID=UPI001E595E42|nr:hypothetical protein [Stieleria sp. JC731]MCC9602953.1 hypothetical protein [Stieleria sp. JC731]
MKTSLILLLNLLATWYMVGLIWMVQLVHYKLFNQVGSDQFIQYEQAHCRGMSPIVIPPMLVELVTACLLVYFTPTGIPRWVLAVGLAAVFGIWLSTFLIQVPCHERLSSQYSEGDYNRLVSSNWIRTVLWTFRGLLMGYIVSRLMIETSTQATTR